MKRNKNESFAEYRERRKKENENIVSRIKGYLKWNSHVNGTYVRYPPTERTNLNEVLAYEARMRRQRGPVKKIIEHAKKLKAA